MNPKILVTINECAQMMSIGRTTVYKLIQQGHLRVFHIGRSARVRIQDIHDLVARLEAEDAA